MRCDYKQILPEYLNSSTGASVSFKLDGFVLKSIQMRGDIRSIRTTNGDGAGDSDNPKQREQDRP